MDPLTLHASTISTNEKVISDISKTFKEDIIENFKFFKILANGGPCHIQIVEMLQLIFLL